MRMKRRGLPGLSRNMARCSKRKRGPWVALKTTRRPRLRRGIIATRIAQKGIEYEQMAAKDVTRLVVQSVGEAYKIQDLESSALRPLE